MPLAGMLGLPSLAEAAQAAASSYRRPKLKITEIRTAEVRVHGYQVHVRVYTDQGIIGQGESTDAAMGNVPLIRSFAPAAGRPGPAEHGGRFRAHPDLRRFCRRPGGQYVTALTGVEIALWDIAGKALGLPVYQLLGGKVRDRVRVYCDSGSREMIPGDERSLARIHEIQEMGFTAAKIDIDDAADPARFDRVNWTASNGEIEHMLAKIAFTREHYPKNIDLAVDMHARYDATTGQARGQGGGAVQADVAGRAGAGREHRRDARHPRLHQHAHLLRREHLYALGIPRNPGEARGRHHHA